MTTIDSSYLSVAVARTVAMVKLAILPDTPPVLDYVDPHAPVPFWWIFLDATQQDEQAEDVNVQVWPLMLRYVIGWATEGYDGTLQKSVYTVLPKVVNYIRARKRLIYQDMDGAAPMEPPRYLDASGVRIDLASAFGVFRNTNQVGIELRLRLPFTIEIDQEY